MYSLGRASMAEITHYANMMGLRTRKGNKIHKTTMHFILENSFYYGEMKTKRCLMPHVYPTLIPKELWDKCQEQKALRAGQFIIFRENNTVYRSLITCGVTNRLCPCELKKGVYSYVTCWRKDNTRIYMDFIINGFKERIKALRDRNKQIDTELENDSTEAKKAALNDKKEDVSYQQFNQLSLV